MSACSIPVPASFPVTGRLAAAGCQVLLIVPRPEGNHELSRETDEGQSLKARAEEKNRAFFKTTCGMSEISSDAGHAVLGGVDMPPHHCLLTRPVSNSVITGLMG